MNGSIMSKISTYQLGRIIYPYWVITKVVALVIASLVYLIVYEAIRYRSEKLHPDVNLRFNSVRR